MKEIVILEAFAGLLKGRIIWDAKGHPEIQIPIPRPIGYSMFDFEEGKNTSTVNHTQIGTFKWMGKTDEEGMKIFQLVDIY